MGGSNTRRRSRKVTSSRAKPLGKAAKRSIRKNNEAIDRFFNGLKKKEKEMPYVLATVTKAHGDAMFDVEAGGSEMRVRLSGPLTGRGKFHHNPNVTTAVHIGSTVLVLDEMIVAVLSYADASYARSLMARSAKKSSIRTSASSSSKKSSNSVFF